MRERITSYCRFIPVGLTRPYLHLAFKSQRETVLVRNLLFLVFAILQTIHEFVSFQFIYCTDFNSVRFFQFSFLFAFQHNISSFNLNSGVNFRSHCLIPLNFCFDYNFRHIFNYNIVCLQFTFQFFLSQFSPTCQVVFNSCRQVLRYFLNYRWPSWFRIVHEG